MVKLWFTVEHKRSTNSSSEVYAKIGIITLYSGFVLFRMGRGITLWLNCSSLLSTNFSSEVRADIGITNYFISFLVHSTKSGIVVWLNCGSQLSTNEAQTFPLKFVPKLVLLPTSVDMYFSGRGGRSLYG